MDYDTWIRCPASTNAVERKNYDSKASVCLQCLKIGLVTLYKMDKATCAKYIVAKKGHSISYNDRSPEKEIKLQRNGGFRGKEKAVKVLVMSVMALQINKMILFCLQKGILYSYIAIANNS